MSYNRKTWTNRNVEHPYRRTLTDTTSGTSQTVDVTRAEGTITAEGDTFDANTMNNMEGRIADEFSLVNQKIGDLNDLDTQDKSSLVDAINEVAQGGGGGGSSTLAGLTDTSISSPTNGQVLKYNSTSSKWENAAESGGGSSNYLVFTYTNSNNTWSFTSVVNQTGTAVLEADVYSLLSAGYDAYVDLVYPIVGGTGRALLKSIYRRGSTSFILGFGEFKQYADADYTRGRVELTIHQNDTSSSDWTFDFSIAEYDAHYVNYDNSSHPTLSSFLDGAIDDLDDQKADIASPAFTGNPTAPTPTTGDDSTKIATTAYVQASHEYQRGESISIAGMLCPFWQTGATVRIFVPLTKTIASDVTASSITQTGNFEIRMYNGSAIASQHPLSDYGTLTFYKLACGIGILISNLNSTWGDTSRYTTGFAYANSGNTIKLGNA